MKQTFSDHTKIITFILFKDPISDLAKQTCRSFGSNWSITRETPGSIVCSLVPWNENCYNCTKWRLVVWKDGADEYPNRYTDNTTIAGSYYCGYYPECEPDHHIFGGFWMNNLRFNITNNVSMVNFLG